MIESGRSLTSWNTFAMYMPMSPKQNMVIPPINHIETISDGHPAAKSFDISFVTRSPAAEIPETSEIANPK